MQDTKTSEFHFSCISSRIKEPIRSEYSQCHVSSVIKFVVRYDVFAQKNLPLTFSQKFVKETYSCQYYKMSKSVYPPHTLGIEKILILAFIQWMSVKAILLARELHEIWIDIKAPASSMIFASAFDTFFWHFMVYIYHFIRQQLDLMWS